MPDLLATPWSQYRGSFKIAVPEGEMEVEGVILGSLGVHCECENDGPPSGSITHLATGWRIAVVRTSWSHACRVAALINRDCPGLETTDPQEAIRLLKDWSKGAGVQPVVDAICSTAECLLP